MSVAAPSTNTHFTTPVDGARLHQFLQPARPTKSIWIAIPETELLALRNVMKAELPAPMVDDLGQLSNVSRDADAFRAAFLHWWFAGADWNAYRQDFRWGEWGHVAKEAACWELSRILSALQPYRRAFREEASPDLSHLDGPWLMTIDTIDVASFLRIRLGYDGYSVHNPEASAAWGQALEGVTE
jgi:hypothetical protein